MQAVVDDRSLCGWCGAPSGRGETCPRCGANYEKAAEIRANGRAQSRRPASAPVALPAPHDSLDARSEFLVCLLTLPLSLLLALFFHRLMPGGQRIFFGMPVHEFGHAVTAWWTGHFAIPGIGATPTWPGRNIVVVLAVTGATAWMIRAAWRAGHVALAASGAALFVVQALGTLAVSEEQSMALVFFGGYGMGMVIAATLMALFHVSRSDDLFHDVLRWCCVPIGAAAFIDNFSPWVFASQHLFATFLQEGGGGSDPTTLVGEYGWTDAQVARRFLVTGVTCLVALAAAYLGRVWRAYRRFAG